MAEKSERWEAGEQARKGSRASARVNALPPRDVVKYVAIYTGDWRHWCLGSERMRASSPPFHPFLALSPGLPNSCPSALIVSSFNPCAGWSGLPDQKSIREIPVSAWAMQNRNDETPPCPSFYPSNLSTILFSLFFHLFCLILFEKKKKKNTGLLFCKKNYYLFNNPLTRYSYTIFESDS